MPDSGSKEFVLDSGAKLLVTPAPFADAHALYKGILKELRGQGIEDLDLKKLAGVKSVSDVFGRADLLGKMVDAALSVASSDSVTSAAFKCAERSTYENVRVSNALFDDPSVGQKAREDYHQIMARILEVNVGPFFARLFSASRAMPAGKSENSLPSK